MFYKLDGNRVYVAYRSDEWSYIGSWILGEFRPAGHFTHIPIGLMRFLTEDYLAKLLHAEKKGVCFAR